MDRVVLTSMRNEQYKFDLDYEGLMKINRELSNIQKRNTANHSSI